MKTFWEIILYKMNRSFIIKIIILKKLYPISNLINWLDPTSHNVLIKQVIRFLQLKINIIIRASIKFELDKDFFKKISFVLTITWNQVIETGTSFISPSTNQRAWWLMYTSLSYFYKSLWIYCTDTLKKCYTASTLWSI